MRVSRPTRSVQCHGGATPSCESGAVTMAQCRVEPRGSGCLSRLFTGSVHCSVSRAAMISIFAERPQPSGLMPCDFKTTRDSGCREPASLEILADRLRQNHPSGPATQIRMMGTVPLQFANDEHRAEYLSEPRRAIRAIPACLESVARKPIFLRI